ncbi:conjugal transfer protein TraR [bacterium]|nr:conjugal transfer protein TraR [bacterium]|tara:strand:- start:1650 stop:2609 length:960 start_codon:yes stop_codon:yes gene_type:complete
MEIFISVVVFLIGIGVLVKSADLFTGAAEKLGKALGAPPFIIGVTIVALGTSLPELASSIIAVIQGSSEIVVGNVIGSNVANIFLVLGIVAIVAKKIKIDFDIIRVDLPFLLGSALLFTVAIWDGEFTWKEGILFLIGIVIYLIYTVHVEKKPKDTEIEEAIKSELPKERKLRPKTIVILVLSGIGIYIGAKFTVDSVIDIAGMLKIGTEIIATTAVALGTSLPELFVSVSAALKGKSGLAAGNILGSSIFNIFAIMGIPALFGVLVIPASVLVFSLPMMLIATFLFVFITQDREITKWEGWLLILFYIFFIGKIVGIL